MNNFKIYACVLVSTFNIIASPPVPVGNYPNTTTYSTYMCVDLSGNTSRLDFTRQSNAIVFANLVSWDFGDEMALGIREVQYFKSIYAQRPSGESNGKPYYTIGNGVNWVQNCELIQPRTGELIKEPQYIPKEQVHKVYQCVRGKNKKNKLHFIQETNTGMVPYFYYGDKLSSSVKIPAQGRYLKAYATILNNTPSKKGAYIIFPNYVYKKNGVRETCTLVSTTKE